MSDSEKDNKPTPAPIPEPQKTEPPKPPKDRIELGMEDDLFKKK